MAADIGASDNTDIGASDNADIGASGKADVGAKGNSNFGSAPRVDVDKPMVLVPLAERDPRIHHLPPFQKLVDATPAGGTLRPKPGLYAGPVVVDKPIVIDGGGKVTIDGGDKSTVFVLRTNSSTLRGLHLTGSGSSHDSDDACLNVRGNNNYIESLVIDNCLFGIDLKQANNNVVRNNKIRSKPVELGIRGDAIRLWYSMGNLVESNFISDSRDTVAWYSNDNIFRKNTTVRSRYSLHFMFDKYNLVDGNRFYNNAVGIYMMYTDGVVVRNNVISHAMGATGMAIGFKESSNSIIENNEIIYCATGIGSDLSPYQPGSTIQIKGNRFAYNSIAIMFNSGDREGNFFTGNTFEGNLTDVAVGGGGSSMSNVWHGNYWDDYKGFDRNNDGIGDKPYNLYAYADRIWMEIPYARFFKNAPLMEAIDFLERLAPFSSPQLVLRDDAPLFHLPRKTRK